MIYEIWRSTNTKETVLLNGLVGMQTNMFLLTDKERK